MRKRKEWKHGGYDCCDMRGMLSFLILFLLSKQAMSGQELATQLEKRKGEKPSPGTIYPALKMLREQKWITEVSGGKSIVYELTPEGKEIFSNSKKHFCKIFGDLF